MNDARSNWAVLTLTILLLVSGCSAAPDGDVEALAEPRAAVPGVLLDVDPMFLPWEWTRPPVRDYLDAPDLVAWTTQGDLVVVDGRSGGVRQTAPTLGLEGERDVVFDAAKRRLWIAEAGAGGEIASHPVTTTAAGPLLGARTHEAWISGAARLLPSAAGAVLFEEGAWRMLAGGGVAGPSKTAPPPASAWVTRDASGTFVRALAYGAASGELDVASAKADAALLGAVSVTALGVDSASLPPCARVVQAPARGGALFVDVKGSFLTVRALDGAKVGATAQVPLGASGLRVEAAVGVDDGAVVVVLLSGVPALVAVEIDADLAIVSMARVPLPGQTTPALPFVSHDLVRQGARRVAAATSAGVYPADVWRDQLGVHLALDAGFAGSELRGPLAGL